MLVADLAPVTLDVAVDRAAAALARLQQPDGHWVFELEADATIPAEYVLLRHYLGEAVDADLEARIGRYLRRIQGAHDGWGLFHAGDFDISASVKAYFALKMIGDDVDRRPYGARPCRDPDAPAGRRRSTSSPASSSRCSPPGRGRRSRRCRPS